MLSSSKALSLKTKWSHIPIVFSESDLKLIDYPHTDAMVIEAHMHGWQVTKVLTDDGSQADILFLSTFEQMGLSVLQLQPVEITLYGFSGKKIVPIWRIALSISFEHQGNARTEDDTFDVVDAVYPYNAIFGRGLLNQDGNGNPKPATRWLFLPLAVGFE